jgi:starch phosphorylase
VNGIEHQVEILANKIKHYLITTMGRTIDEATDQEFYQALCWSLREEIMINWAATNHTFARKKVRKLYYISMEYMPGRLLVNNITNLAQIDIVAGLFKKVNRSFQKILNLETEIGIGNGGLGRLASCLMDSLATQQYPAVGYGLRYQYGIFEQEILLGKQVERPDCWLLFENPWEFRRDGQAVFVHFGGEYKKRFNSKGAEVYDLYDSEEVRALPFDYPIVGYSNASNFPVLTLRIWSTKDSPRNFSLQRFNAGDTSVAGENTGLTDVLYPNDNHETGKRIRLKQEFLLVTASLQDIINEHLSLYGDLDLFAEKVRIQINDTHPALAIVELIHLLMHHHEMTLEKAFDVMRSVISYTNHTVLKEALEEWNVQRLKTLLPRQYEILLKLDQMLKLEVEKKFPQEGHKFQEVSIIKGDQARMAHLAIFGSHKVNGVARLHSDLLKDYVFKDFFSLYPDKFTNVTNGITQRRWLLTCNPLLASFITEKIGFDWIIDFSKIKKFENFADDPATQEKILEIKISNKKRLIETVGPLLFERHKKTFDSDYTPFLGVDALFDVQIKRIHEYKRQLMNALHVLMLFHEIQETSQPRQVKRMVIFSGKAAPGYELAKSLITFIYCLSRAIENHPIAKNHLKIAYIENYNVTHAELIIPAADLSEQISTASCEASGTGNMKLAINGALTIGTHDGANIEMKEAIGEDFWPFGFGATANQNIEMTRNHTYRVHPIVEQYPNIKKAVHSLVDGSLAKNDDEKKALKFVYQSLMEGIYGSPADRYFVINDLMDYYKTQQKVEQYYLNKPLWAKHVIKNIAGMGFFSTDRAIDDYANKIWHLEKTPLDMNEVAKIRQEYSEMDRCRIF